MVDELKRKRNEDEGEEEEEMMMMEEATTSAAAVGGRARSDDLLFQIQIGELLKEVRGVGEGSHEALEDHVQGLTDKIAEAWDPSAEVLSVDAGGDYLGCAQAAQEVRAEPPTEFRVVGSLALGTSEEISKRLSVDVAVVVPDSVFTKKDFLSHRYAAKRSLYLAHLVNAVYRVRDLSKASVRYEFLGNDARKPAAVASTTWRGKVVEIRLIPCISPATFEPHYLHPRRCNIKTGFERLGRPKPWKTGGRSFASKSENGEPVTPLYTTAIAEDAMLLEHHRFLEASLSKHRPLRDAVVLLKIWARKHGLVAEGHGVAGGLLTALACHVWRSREVSASASALQAFRILLEGIGSLDFSEGASCRDLAGAEGHGPSKDPPGLTPFRETFESVFLDSTGWVNLAARMPTSVAETLSGCASRAASVLGSFLPAETKFEKLFLARPYFGMHHDHHIRVELSSGPGAAAFGGDLSLWADQERLVERVATMALGRRVLSAQCGPRPLRPQVVRKSDRAARLLVSRPELEDGGIDLFLRSNADLAHSAVDVGPANTEKELCRNFRSFWGERSQLRQFKDTRIAEAVIWSLDREKPHLLLLESLTVALQRNAKPPGGRISVSTRETALDFLLEASSAGEDKPGAIRAFDKLSRMLKSLDGLPLRIESVQVASSLFRRTEPMPLRRHDLCGARPAKDGKSYKSHVPVIECFAGLEGSRRWPRNPELQRKTLAAMALHAASTLERSFGIACIGTEDHVDILYEGYAFRLRLHSLGGPSGLSSDEVGLKVKHHAAISGLATRNPPYCAAVRLAKRWLGAQLLSPHFCQEAVELMVAEAFCNPSCLPPPGSHWSGFLRFLHNLASFPWDERAMYVDATRPEEVSVAEHREKVEALEASFARATGGGKAFLAAPHQADPERWAGGAGAEEACRSAARAASSSLRFLDQEMPSADNGFGRKVLAVFTPNLEFYDVLLRLHPASVPLWKYFACVSDAGASNRAEAVGESMRLQTVKNTAESGARAKLIVGENLAMEAVRRVQALLGDRALVGYDEFAGTTVGIAWNPAFFVPSREPREGEAGWVVPVRTGEGKAFVPNVLALMDEVCAGLRGFLSGVEYL